MPEQEILAKLGQIETQVALNNQAQVELGKLIGKVEQHLRDINGNCRTHTLLIAGHETRLAVLDEKQAEAQRAAQVQAPLQEARKAKFSFREDWWKIALVLMAGGAAGGAGVLGQVLTKL